MMRRGRLRSLAIFLMMHLVLASYGMQFKGEHTCYKEELLGTDMYLNKNDSNWTSTGTIMSTEH